MSPSRFLRSVAIGLLVLLASTLSASTGVSAQSARTGDVVNTVVTAGDTGRYSSVLLDASGNPVIAYYDTSAMRVELVHCRDADCAGSVTPSILGPSLGLTDLALVLDAAGRPQVAFTDDEGDLTLVSCGNTGCTTGNTTSVLDGATSFALIGSRVDMVLDGDGNPVLAYSGGPSGSDTAVMHCDDPQCIGPETSVVIDTGADPSSIVVALAPRGTPTVLWHRSFAELAMMACTNADCSGGQTLNILDDGNVNTVGTDFIYDGGGNPVVVYNESSDLRVLRCSEPDCRGRVNRTTVDQVAFEPRLALSASGRPIIVYNASSGGDLEMLRCTNPRCTGDLTPVALDAIAEGRDGRWPAMTLDNDGNPVISYQSSADADLELLHCYDAAGCGARDERIPPQCEAFQGANVVLGNRGGERLVGTRGSDVFVARGGNDVIRARGGSDCILAGAGRDTVLAGGGADLVFGQAGRDRLRGQGGPDELFGNGGRDILDGGGGSDVLDGGPGNDRCISGGPADVSC